MANLSKIKRKKMLEYLEKLKEINNDDENIRAITEIENSLNKKKYGLVWEEHSEKVDEMLEHNIPIFVEDETRKITAKENEAYNFLLEGDNLHSLKLLEKTHKGKIDVIYIDPPYNTGNKDFVYDDCFVDKTDGYSHSKWLSFMEKRLLIARELLSENGVIFISISDIENANLILLCNSIFGEQNFVANLVWANKEGGGSSDSKLFRIKHEYIVVYSKDVNNIEIKGVPIGNVDRYKLSDEHEKIRGKYYLQKLGMGSIQYSASLDYPIETPDGGIIYPKDNNNGKKACWRWSKDKFEWGIINEFVEIKKDSKGMWTVYTKQYLNCDNNGNLIERNNRPMGIIDDFSSTQGAKLIKQLLEDVTFSYPKDKNLIKWLIDRINNVNAIVLDFFAGSGTTGHAVMQLNKEDGGNRKCILCTNNENNICEEVTYQRLKNIQEELPHNLKYYKTDFIPKFSDDGESISEKMMEHIRELIELEYAIELDGKKYIVLNDEEGLDDAISKIENDGKLFVRSGIFLSRSNQRILEEKDVSIIEIPEYYFREELKEVGEL